VAPLTLARSAAPHPLQTLALARFSRLQSGHNIPRSLPSLHSQGTPTLVQMGDYLGIARVRVRPF
jgi:hypothetical protein